MKYDLEDIIECFQTVEDYPEVDFGPAVGKEFPNNEED